MKLKTPKIKLKEEDILPISVAVLSGIQVVQVLVLFLLASSFYTLARQPARTLIQRQDGTAFAAEPQQSNYREAKVVRQFVKDWVTLQFTWSGKLADPQGEGTIKDEGIFVDTPSEASTGKRQIESQSSDSANPSVSVKRDNSKQLPGLARSFLGGRDSRVPTIAWQAAFLLPDYERHPFLQLLAKDWVPRNYFSSSDATTTVVNFDYLSDPQLIDKKQGIWRLELLSTINYFNRKAPVGKPRSFDRTIIVAPVEIPNKPLPTTASAYERLVYQMRERGLQIVKIQPGSVQANNNVYRDFTAPRSSRSGSK